MSVGELVKIWTDVGGRKPLALLAKIVDVDSPIFVIKYLTEKKDDGIWMYEDDVYEIDSYSIAEYLKTECETDAGFKEVPGGYIKIEFEDEDEDETDETEEDEEETDETEEDEDEDDGNSISDESLDSSGEESEDSLGYD